MSTADELDDAAAEKLKNHKKFKLETADMEEMTEPKETKIDPISGPKIELKIDQEKLMEESNLMDDLEMKKEPKVTKERIPTDDLDEQNESKHDKNAWKTQKTKKAWFMIKFIEQIKEKNIWTNKGNYL
eukprot:1273703-Ditylum_brightwellii.AAC.2